MWVASLIPPCSSRSPSHPLCLLSTALQHPRILLPPPPPASVLSCLSCVTLSRSLLYCWLVQWSYGLWWSMQLKLNINTVSSWTPLHHEENGTQVIVSSWTPLKYKSRKRMQGEKRESRVRKWNKRHKLIKKILSLRNISRRRKTCWQRSLCWWISTMKTLTNIS